MISTEIAFLTIAFQRGGAERVISTLSQQLKCNSRLILYKLANLDYPFNGRTFSLDGSAPTNLRIGRFLRRLITLHRLLTQEQVTALISFMPRPNILALLLKITGLYRGRVIINEVNVVSERQISRTMRWCIARLYPKADLVIVPSLDIRNDLVTEYGVPGDKISVIYNPFDVATIIRQSKEPIILPWVEGNIPIIVSAGRLTAQKGFDLLIEAFARIRSKMNVRLVILGNGECEASLRQLAADRGVASDVHFAGWQLNPYAFFSRADVFVLSSRYEGFGNVIVEAMSCGLPIVSTDCPGGPAEILKNGEFGFLIPPEDPEALADAIIRILLTNELRRDLAQKSLQRCLDFDVSVVMKRWQEAIECRG